MNQSNITHRKTGFLGRDLSLLFPVWAVVWLLLFVSCAPSQAVDEPLATTETPAENFGTTIPTIQKSATPATTRTPSPSVTLTPLPAKTAQPVSVATPTSTRVAPLPTTSPTPYPLQGTLLIAGEGFYELPLATGEPTYLLERQNDWITWRPTYSPANERVVYWVKTTEATELWTTSVNSWAPERLLYLPGTDYVGVGYFWLNTNRHLVVLFSVLDDVTGVTTRVSASYIFDLVEKKPVSPADWQGFCTVLAVSPRTGHLSSWCSIEDELSGQLTYLVVELDESVWISEEPPQVVLTERENWNDYSQMWIWSGDGKYVAYTIVDIVDGEVEDTLYYSRTDRRDEPVTLSDGSTKLFGVISLSWDGQYITYPGRCQDGSGCRVVMQTATQDVVWTSRRAGGDLYWSPDNRFFAQYDFPGIVIVDISTQEIVLRFDNLPAAGEIVWLEQ